MHARLSVPEVCVLLRGQGVLKRGTTVTLLEQSLVQAPDAECLNTVTSHDCICQLLLVTHSHWLCITEPKKLLTGEATRVHQTSNAPPPSKGRGLAKCVGGNIVLGALGRLLALGCISLLLPGLTM